MAVDLKPETERLVHEEIQRGHFQSVDEMIVEGVTAWREKHQTEPVKLRKRLYDLLTQPPFSGSDLKVERQRDYPQQVDLG